MRLPPVDSLRRLALAAIVALAAGLRFANLGSLGYANHYYTAAVKSMLQSWHNFFFVAAEPGGAVSVDKPPAGLWVQTISAYFFGVNGFGVLLPEIIAGVLSVALLYYLVRRSFGSVAGLLAALALAITPVVVATDRNNTIDSLLIFTLLLAVWAFSKATTGQRRYLFLGAALVGIGFNIKMLQAYLPLPAFYALYFFGATEQWWRKAINLALATALLLVISLSWATVVDLTPAGQRPFVGSSGSNSVFSLALGYNGLQRLVGMGGFGGPGGNRGGPPTGAGGPPSAPAQMAPAGAGLTGQTGAAAQFGPPPGANGQQPGPGNPGGGGPGGPPGGGGGGFPGTGQASPWRLFVTPLSKEVSWLLPFGLFGLGLVAFCSRLRWPLAPRQQAAVLWGGWLLTGISFFSVAQFFHEYYLSMLGAPLAALVGIGVAELWRIHGRRPWLAGGLLLAAAGGTLALQYVTATAFIDNAWWLRLVLALFVIGAALLVISAWQKLPHGSMAGFACIVAAMLITPGIWSGLTSLNASGNQSLPSAYSGQRQGGGPPGMGRPAGRETPEAPVAQPPAETITGEEALVKSANTGLQLNQTLLDYLEPRTQNTAYLMAVPSSMQGADYVIATGRPVLYLGGFNGVDQVVTADDFAKLVTTGKLRFVYWGDSGGGPGGGGPGFGPGEKSAISTWITANCSPVTGFETKTSNFGAPDGTRQASGPGNSGSSDGMRVSLYDCGG